MYEPKFTITPRLLGFISQIDQLKERINQAPIVPAYENKIKQEALVRMIHYGTRIEGNRLSEAEARRIIEGDKLVGFERDTQEILNYRRVVEFIDRLTTPPGAKPRLLTEFEVRIPFEVKWHKNRLIYSEEMIKKINQVTTDNLVDPSNSGGYRKDKVIVENLATGEVVFRPPSAVEVPFLIKQLLEYVNDETARQLHPVVRAAIAHYFLVAIHPFVEGNGRTARAFALVILFAEGYDMKGLFSLEEYFYQHLPEYYGALVRVSNNHADLALRDLSFWLEFYAQAMAAELSRLEMRIKEIAELVPKVENKKGEQVEINQRQMVLLSFFKYGDKLKMGQARLLLPEMSDDTILRELQDLQKKGLIVKKGRTKGAYYQLVLNE
ncbi:MAG: Fic family protein [bacterium]|nr:Fic family protein [bacterium]